MLLVSFFLLVTIPLCLGKVVIVGAGMSGLAAALKLKQYGFDVIVLEAQNRIGGRIHTVKFKDSLIDAYVDIGAQWIHGQIGNPIFDLAQSLDLVDYDTIMEDADFLYATQDAKIVPPNIVNQYFKQINTCFDQIYAEDITYENDESLGQLIDKCIADNLARIPSNERSLAKAVYDNRLKTEREETACSNLSELSVAASSLYDSFEGDYMTNLKTGYGAIIDYLVSQIGETKIIVNQTVQLIDYNNSSKVLVYVSNTFNGAKSVYEADQVLVTVSTGYLKSNYKTLFSPGLNQEKINTIEKLGFGNIEKYFLVYDDDFDKDFHGLQIIWRDDLVFALTPINGCPQNLKDFYQEIEAFDVHPSIKNILFSLVEGETATFMSTLSETCLINIFNKLFGSIYPNVTLPKLQKIIRSDWGNNNYVKGGYSFVRYGMSEDDLPNLIKPIDSRIYFGGEATDEKYISSVHGAYISGLREALKIKNSSQILKQTFIYIFLAVIMSNVFF